MRTREDNEALGMIKRITRSHNVILEWQSIIFPDKAYLWHWVVWEFALVTCRETLSGTSTCTDVANDGMTSVAAACVHLVT